MAGEHNLVLHGRSKQQKVGNLIADLKGKGILPKRKGKSQRMQLATADDKHSEDGSQPKSNHSSRSGRSVKELNKEIEILKLKKQMQDKELADKEKARQLAEKELADKAEAREFELQKMRLQATINEAEYDRNPTGYVTSRASPGVKVKLPPFDSKDPERSFSVYEKILTSLNIPNKDRCKHVTPLLVNKGQEAFLSMDTDDCNDWETLKNTVLLAYRITPTELRNRFRNLRMQPGQSCAEFGSSLSRKLDSWLRASEVDDFESLRNVLLIEQFMQNLSDPLRIFLAEKDLRDFAEVLECADLYLAVHKTAGTVESSRGHSRGKFQRRGGRTGGGGGRNPKADKDVETAKESSKEEGDHKAEAHKPKINRGRFPPCAECGKTNHKIADCWRRNRSRSPGKQESSQTTVKHVGFVNALDNPTVIDPESEYKGTAKLSTEGSDPIDVTAYFDSGSDICLARTDLKIFNQESDTSLLVNLQGIGGNIMQVPLHEATIEWRGEAKKCTVGLLDDLPRPNVALLIGLNFKTGTQGFLKIRANPPSEELDAPTTHSAAVTRSQAKRALDPDEDLQESSLTVDQAPHVPPPPPKAVANAQHWINLQRQDPTLKDCWTRAATESSTTEFPRYQVESDLLYRCTLDGDGREYQQLVVPESERDHLIGVAHGLPEGAHIGVKRTYARLHNWYYWPNMYKHVQEHTRACEACQKTGKERPRVPTAPLRPIPADVPPFSHVLADIVGPLKRTRKGHQYILTLMCLSTRYPEAYPLRNPTVRNILPLIRRFMSTYGYPRVFHTDRGSVFTSKMMKEVLQELGVTQVTSSSWHPTSQACLERMHGPLKQSLRTFCYDQGKDWDEGLDLILFTFRDSIQASLQFSPFDLVFGHTIRGPLSVVREQVSAPPPTLSTSEYVEKMREHLDSARRIAAEHLKDAQHAMKERFDLHAKVRTFDVGDLVLALRHDRDNTLETVFDGPYEVTHVIPNDNYVIEGPCTSTVKKKKVKTLHVNQLKAFHQAPAETVSCAIVLALDKAEPASAEVGCDVKRNNSTFLQDPTPLLSHLDPSKQADIRSLLADYSSICSDVPTLCNKMLHDINVEGHDPVRQPPYPVRGEKLDVLNKEVQFMLDNGIIEPCSSPWGSPCILVPKSTGGYRLCTDFRRVNQVSKGDNFPIPRLTDLIDNVGHATYVTRMDLMKGFYQVGMTERAKEISAMVVPSGQYRYLRMPFGLSGSPTSFQRIMTDVIRGLNHTDVYIDDICVYDTDWTEHMANLRALFDRLREANLTLNLDKCAFGHAKVQYLGHEVGSGEVKPLAAHVKAILDMPSPTTRKDLRRFLGSVSFYRRFCENLSEVETPLTNLCSNKVRFNWTAECEKAFQEVKMLIATSPVLTPPDFTKPFVLSTDASGHAVGSVLWQRYGQVKRPVAYFSKKMNRHQRNYSTVEQELLALILSLNHFAYYLTGSPGEIEVETDHNPLTFLATAKNKNHRLLRWSLQLANYPIRISHIAGKQNIVPDMLSRI